jgi:hypothetical protein
MPDATNRPLPATPPHAELSRGARPRRVSPPTTSRLLARGLLVWALLASVMLASGLLAACGGETAPQAPPSDGRPSIAITVDASGYHPSEAAAAPGQPVRLVFTRTTDEGCGQQLVFPDLDIRRDLPLNEAVAVDLTMPASGSVRFTCGMDMYQGSLIAR